MAVTDMVLATPTPLAEREDDRTNSEGVLVFENKSPSISTTGTEETSKSR